MRRLTRQAFAAARRSAGTRPRRGRSSYCSYAPAAARFASSRAGVDAVVDHAGAGTTIHEQLHDLRLRVQDRVLERRRPAVGVATLDIRSVIEHGRRDRGTTVEDRPVQRRRRPVAAHEGGVALQRAERRRVVAALDRAREIVGVTHVGSPAGPSPSGPCSTMVSWNGVPRQCPVRRRRLSHTRWTNARSTNRARSQVNLDGAVSLEPVLPHRRHRADQRLGEPEARSRALDRPAMVIRSKSGQANGQRAGRGAHSRAPCRSYRGGRPQNTTVLCSAVTRGSFGFRSTVKVPQRV